MVRSNRITREVVFAGAGVHSGEPCTLRLEPGAAGQGCWIRSGGERFAAVTESVQDVQRCTVVGGQRARLATVEHLFSALSALKVYDLEIHADGPEVPIMDGSALPFWQELQAAVEPGELVEPLRLEQPVWVGNDSSQVLALPAAETLYRYSLYYPHAFLGYQEASFAPDSQSFGEELAPARTFALQAEVEWLQAQGLARGGSLDNALLVRDDGLSSPLRLPNEPVRHKCLDLVGDLYLLGKPLQAQVIAIKAGHRWHVDLARKIRQEVAGHVQ